MFSSTRWTLLLALPLTLLLLAACDSVIDDPPQSEVELLTVQDIVVEGDEVTAETIEQGEHGFMTERNFDVIRDEAEFATLWQNLYSHRDELPERPEVDFDETYVVFAALGERPTGGYTVQVTDARYMTEQNEVMVEVTERTPAANCTVIQVLTFPFTLATVDAVAGAEYVFEEGEPEMNEDC